MSEKYVPVPRSGLNPAANGNDSAQEKLDAVKHEAREMKDTVVEEASSVTDSAKEEAGEVLRETKSQAKDLYAQTQAELKEQARVQQQRVATGLRSLGDEFGSMAQSSENQGLATDLVRQASDRVDTAASWLDARDPGSLLNEVKSYARNKPGMFIAIAGMAGLVAGRLTRSLADVASDEKDDESGKQQPLAGSEPDVDTPRVYATGPVRDDTPLYAERATGASADYDLSNEGLQR